jgi:hypothetical protein
MLVRVDRPEIVRRRPRGAGRIPIHPSFACEGVLGVTNGWLVGTFGPFPPGVRLANLLPGPPFGSLGSYDPSVL